MVTVIYDKYSRPIGVRCFVHGDQPLGEDYTCPLCWLETEFENVCDLCGYELESEYHKEVCKR
jgi:predicted amidophosphoribosyltransferase